MHVRPLASTTSPASVLEIISSSLCDLMIFLVIFLGTDIMAFVQQFTVLLNSCMFECGFCKGNNVKKESMQIFRFRYMVV
jgi:hypothetical protein